MDNYDTAYNTICRVCLLQNSTQKMVSLFDKPNNDNLSSFGKAINFVTDVSLEKDDKLPNMMCQKCAYLLKHAVYFKLKCESTNQRLKRLINTDTSGEYSVHNIKEKVCEYVMFHQYFPLDTMSEASNSRAAKQNDLQLDILDSNQGQNSTVKQLKLEVSKSNKSDDFDDFIDNDDITNCINEKSEEYSNDSNCVLDTIQNIINTGTNTSTFENRKLNKQQRRFHYKRPGQRNLICNICHKTLANRLTYDHHMQRHNLHECKFICDQCGKGFPVLSEMHMHQIARHGIGPYLKCDHCPYKAPRKLNLIEHLRLHTGERPFTCEKCGLTFRRRAIWRNHLVHHMEKTHQCTYCPRKFFRREQVLAHCNNVHERLYMYMCNICSITYTKTETVRRHMLVKHGIPREKQGRIARVPHGNNESSGKVI